jgi:pilus assembly protein CpaD
MSSSCLSIARSRGARRTPLLLARLLAAAGCATMLAGCYTDQLVYSDQAAAVPIADYRLRHPITIKEGARGIDIFVASRRGNLTASQRGDLVALAHEWHREATGGILIDLPTGTANEGAAANVLPEIRSILVAAGVPVQGVGTRSYHPDDPAALATIHVSYSTMQATAGPCGLWPHDLGPDFDREHNENVEYWNFGCASQRNLAAMVENPADLVQPRGEEPAYEGRRTVVLDKYRNGLATAAVDPTAGKGKISDIGQ